MVCHEGVGFAVRRIHLPHFRQPAIRRAVREHFDGGMNGHGVQGFGRNLQCLVSFRRGGFGIGILQRQVGHQLVRFDELGIEFDRFFRLFDGFVVEAVGAHQSQSKIGLCVFGIALDGLLEEIGGVLIIKALVQQSPPADPAVRVCRRLSDRGAKFVVCLLIHLQAPEAFGANGRFTRLGQGLKACVGLIIMPMLAQGLAFFGRGRAGEARAAEGSRQRRSQNRGSGLSVHFSSSCCTRASSTRAAVSWFLYSSSGMAAFSYFSLSIFCSSASFLASKSRLAGSAAAL